MTSGYVRKSTDQLRVGDIVDVHGMRCLIDRELKVVPDMVTGNETVWNTAAKVLNRGDVPSERVPMHWTASQYDLERGWFYDYTDPRWTIQGNRRADWNVEATPEPERDALEAPR